MPKIKKEEKSPECSFLFWYSLLQAFRSKTLSFRRFEATARTSLRIKNDLNWFFFTINKLYIIRATMAHLIT